MPLHRMSCAAVALLVFAMASCSEGRDTELGISALSGGSGPICTYVPEDWSARCAAGLGQPSRCHHLARAGSLDEQELAALSLNLWSSASGRIGRGLGDLHFGHGARLEWSIDRLLELTRHHPDDQVRAAVRDANRAFIDCTDAQVAVRWVETPICGVAHPGLGGRVSGPASARCVALDGDCRRGRYDSVLACCGETELPPGAVCGEEATDRSQRSSVGLARAG